MRSSKKSTLVDAGPLVAAFSKGDKHHGATVEFLSRNRGALVTTWPAITEACHLLRRSPKARIDLLQWVARGGLTAHEAITEQIVDLIAYMEKYFDIPMDLADASIMVTAIELGIRDIASTDSDFEIYRLPNRARLKNVLFRGDA